MALGAKREGVFLRGLRQASVGVTVWAGIACINSDPISASVLSE